VLIGLASAAVLVAALYVDVPFLAVWQRSLSDLLFIPQAPAERIVIVGIDDDSLTRLGRWPWPRDVHARLLDILTKGGAQAVGIDLAFTETSTSTADAALAGGIERNGRTVLPLMFDLAPTQSEPALSLAEGVQRPIPEIAAAASGLGHVNVVPDPDGIVRTVPMVVGFEGERFPAFSLTVLSEAEPAFRTGVSQTGNTLVAGVRTIPLEMGGRLRVNFAGPRGSFRTYSYADVLSGAVGPAIFKDRIVLVGITAKALGDYFMTPGAEGTLVPGVEVHANALNTVLRGDFLVAQPASEAALFVLVLAVASGAVFSRFKALTSGIIAIALVVLTVVVAVARFQGGVVDNMVYPPLAVLLTYTCVTTYRVVFEGAEKRRVQTLFGRYLKPEVVQQLVAAEGEIVKLEGVEKEITVLFADIRGFTAMSENLQPQEVVAMLNHYLDFMTKVIFKHDGTLDKYIGDCIMAFWNAPHDQPDHALRAVKAALDMQCEMQTALDSAPTCDVPPVSFGIGVNSGPAVVGNMGSSLRHDFTVIGDAVNFSSRMCGAAGAGEVIISPATYALIKDSVVVEEMPPRKFKGKAAESVTYNVLGLKDEAEPTPTSGSARA
jgi:adenylate cyclase